MHGRTSVLVALPPPRQTGRSDLCSRHQHGSSGLSTCFVIRVTQLCQMSQVCRNLPRYAEIVALATAHALSDLPLIGITSIQRLPGHTARVCLCQIASTWLKRPWPTPDPRWCFVELSVCICPLAGDVLSAQAGRGAVIRYSRGGNDGWCMRVLRSCVSAHYRTQ